MRISPSYIGPLEGPAGEPFFGDSSSAGCSLTKKEAVLEAYGATGRSRAGPWSEGTLCRFFGV